MMEWIRFGCSALSLTVGIAVFAVGIFGFYKYSFILNRMHSAALLDTIGLFFILLSVEIASGFTAFGAKGFLVLLFLWLTSPIASHLIAKMEYFTDDNLQEEITNSLSDVKGNDNADDL